MHASFFSSERFPKKRLLVFDKMPLPKHWIAGVVLLWLALFAVRLTGPPYYTDKDQERPASYIMDVVQNGNWIVQRDFTGDITSKPPLYTWLGALVMLPGGRMNALVLYLPTALATLGVTMLVLFAGARYWGKAAGLFGSVFYLSNSGIWKQIALARTDALFSFTVAWAALEAYRAWTGDKGWVRFWLAASVSTLTKGPLGVLLACGGLLAAWIERRTGHSAGFNLKRFLWPGIIIWLFLSLGWFALSLLVEGNDVFNKIIQRELIGHLIGGQAASGGGISPAFTNAYKPLFYFVSRFAPWSLISLAAFWIVWKRPSKDETCRRFERFLLCWFIVGLTIFSIAGHVRGDLIFPLIPPAALLAGKLAADLLNSRSQWKPFAVAVAIGSLSIAGAAFEYIVLHARDGYSLQTTALRDLAAELNRDKACPPLVHLDTPFTFQMYLNTFVPVVNLNQSAALLDGEAASWVTVGDLPTLRAALKRPGRLHVLREIKIPGMPPFYLVSNQKFLDVTKHSATRFGALGLELENVRVVSRTERELRFAATATTGSVTVHNDTGEKPVIVRLRIEGTQRGVVGEEKRVAPGEVWKFRY